MLNCPVIFLFISYFTVFLSNAHFCSCTDCVVRSTNRYAINSQASVKVASTENGIIFGNIGKKLIAILNENHSY